MFERFTDRARRVVVNAQGESRAYNHAHIGTEHLLLGLIRDGNGLAARALEALGITHDAVRRQVEEAIVPGEGSSSGHIPFTDDAKSVLELSLREAQEMAHSYIGTEHILLGLIRQGGGLAAQILTKLGVDLERTRAEVRRLASAPPAEVGAADRLGRIERQIAMLSERLAAVEHRLDGLGQATAPGS